MALFVVRADTSAEALDFFAQTAKRLEGHNFLKNPFYGKIARFGELYVVDIKPIYFNASPFVFLSLCFMVVLWGWSWWMMFLVVFSSSYFFWTKWFFYPILKHGLRKSGYKGTVKLCGAEDALREVMTDWDSEK